MFVFLAFICALIISFVLAVQLYSFIIISVETNMRGGRSKHAPHLRPQPALRPILSLVAVFTCLQVIIVPSPSMAIPKNGGICPVAYQCIMVVKSLVQKALIKLQLRLLTGIAPCTKNSVFHVMADPGYCLDSNTKAWIKIYDDGNASEETTINGVVLARSFKVAK